MAAQTSEPRPATAPVSAGNANIPAPASPAGAPAAVPPITPVAGDENPYNEVDAAFTKAAMVEPPVKPKEEPKKDAKAGAPTKIAATAEKPAPKEPKELRAELDRVKGELQTKIASYSTLETKIKEYEAKGKDTSALTERLSTLEKQMEAKDAEIRALKQEASPEFKKKYDEPFNRLADRARAVFEQIDIEDAEAGTTRKASWKGDFVHIYNLNEFAARKEAKRILGEDGAAVAMDYYRELHKLDDDRRVALEEERRQWKERETADQAKAVQTREEINRIWQQTNKDLSEKVEDYHDSPEDKELTEARNKALAIFDAPTKTLKDKIIKDAHNRQRVAAFPVLKLKLAKALQELAELKAENEGLKEKPPGKTARPGGASAAKSEDSFEDYIRKSVTAP